MDRGRQEGTYDVGRIHCVGGRWIGEGYFLKEKVEWWWRGTERWYNKMNERFFVSHSTLVFPHRPAACSKRTRSGVEAGVQRNYREENVWMYGHGYHEETGKAW